MTACYLFSSGIRTLYVSTGNLAYCTLRSDLLMALHGAEVAEIYTLDPCHNFTWCLSACVKDNTIDMTRFRELVAVHNTLEMGPIRGDIGMIMLDPAATQTFVTAVYARLKLIFAARALPRDDEFVCELTRLW